MTSPLTYEDLNLPTFLNSREVGIVGGTSLTVTDAITAAHLVRNNVFVAGKKGVGKTQLLFDILDSRYGGKGKIVEGRVDLKADEVFKQMNLEKLRGAKTSAEVVELAQAVNYHFFGADEINRCPEVTQNELLSIMNGYILHHGEPVNLGLNHCVGLATGNLGNGEYVGTFRLDGALADRLHLFLNLDYWKPTDEDMAKIDLRRKIDPRVKRAAEKRDLSDCIISAYEQIKSEETPFEIIIFGRYLERALDYCSTFDSAENSKDNLKEAWPAICTQKNCAKKKSHCSRVKAVGQRTVEASENLAKGLQYLARLKNPETASDPLGAMQVAVRLMLPYSGVISPAYLREEGMFNNPDLAAKVLAAEIAQQVNLEFRDGNKPGALTLAFAYASKGRLTDYPYHPRSTELNFIQPHLRMINEHYKP